MKKLLLLLSICVFAFATVGCTQKNIEGSLEEIMTKVYKDIKQEELPMMLGNVEVNSENVEYYLGSDEIEFEEALASESGVGSIAYSVVLLRAKKGADIEALKKQIKESVNPAKWICVSVEEKNIIVDNKGDLVILIMSNNLSTEIHEGFQNLK